MIQHDKRNEAVGRALKRMLLNPHLKTLILLTLTLKGATFKALTLLTLILTLSLDL